jgi:hypothetical protein
VRTYRYVGPPDIKARSATHPPGREIRTPADLRAWLTESAHPTDAGQLVPATFVIDPAGRLLIADRHSEHVACAAGRDVLAAGEIFFLIERGSAVSVAEVTNQSTGYCPEPTCWPAVEAALDRIGLDHPPGFTTECIFRKCQNCGARNIVKDGWYHCDVCGHPLAAEWNFHPSS